jgi:hypothetical protein
MLPKAILVNVILLIITLQNADLLKIILKNVIFDKCHSYECRFAECQFTDQSFRREMSSLTPT